MKPISVGKLRQVATRAAGSSPAVTVSYSGYDALGRPLQSTEAVTGYLCGSVACKFGYTWNRAGGLSTYTLPSVRIPAKVNAIPG